MKLVSVFKCSCLHNYIKLPLQCVMI